VPADETDSERHIPSDEKDSERHVLSDEKDSERHVPSGAYLHQGVRWRYAHVLINRTGGGMECPGGRQLPTRVSHAQGVVGSYLTS
jgi:hypothetical protein